MADRCRSCQAPIVWAITEKGHRIPLDPDPTPAGTIVLDDDGIAHVPRIDEDKPFLMHVSHFATCPDAAKYRKRARR